VFNNFYNVIHILIFILIILKILSRVYGFVTNNNGFWIGEQIYWPLTCRIYKQLLHCCPFSHYKSLHTESSRFTLTSLYNSSQQWLFLCNVFTVRFLARDFNTGLHSRYPCTTAHTKFSSHTLKSSQADEQFLSWPSPTYNCLQLKNLASRYIASGWTTAEKTPLLYCWSRASGVVQEPSPRGPQETPLLNCWPRACCERCLAVGLYVTIRL
jgi:hypothetical protein